MTSRGFTLIEVLVALGVLGIAVVALVKLQGDSTATADGVRERLFAQIVAENHLIEVMTAPKPVEAGTTSGESDLAGMRWEWTQVIAVAARGVTRIEVSVRRDDAPAVLASLAGFRTQP